MMRGIAITVIGCYLLSDNNESTASTLFTHSQDLAIAGEFGGTVSERAIEALGTI